MPRPPRDRPAPGRLELIRSFVNTLDLDTGRDDLFDLDGVERWFATAGLPCVPRPSSASDLEQVLRVREAFRSVLVAHSEQKESRAALASLNRVIEEARVSVRFASTTGAELDVPATGVAGALGQLTAIALEAILVGTWPRLKACPATACHWAYYDRSRNSSSRWCDMAVCGDRAKRKARSAH